MASTRHTAKYWVGVCYPENMIETWKEEIGDILQVPYCYVVHDKDHLGTYKAARKADQERMRKLHVHIMLAFVNTTTENHALNTFNRLSAEGKKCCPKAVEIIGVRNQYEYLLHNTKTCKKQGKYLYPVEERIEGNNFDIGAYEQISVTEKFKMKMELADFISAENIYNFSDFYIMVRSGYDDAYVEIVTNYSAFFERLTKGNYQKIFKENNNGK